MPTPLSHTIARPLVLAVATLSLALAAGCKKKPKDDSPPDSGPPPVNPGAGDGSGAVGGTGNPPAAPAGWFEARDTVAGYRLLMPNKTIFHANYQRQSLDKMQATSCSHYTKGQDVEPFVRTVTYVPPANFKIGTTPDELFAAFSLSHRNFESFSTILEKKSVTLGGRPALKIAAKPVDITAGAKLPDDPVLAQERLEERKKREAKRTIYFVTTTATRVVLLEIIAPADPGAEFVKTVTDSFAFQ